MEDNSYLNQSMSDIGLPLKTSLVDGIREKKSIGNQSKSSKPRSQAGFSYYFKNSASFGSKQLSKRSTFGFKVGFGMISFNTFGIEAESLRKIKISSRKRNST